MKRITKSHWISLSLFLTIGFLSVAQDPTTNQQISIPVEGEQATSERNTFVDYNSYILQTQNFKFRKELKKEKKASDFLEYATADNSIRISKYDYLRLMRKSINQSDTQKEFIRVMTHHFPDTENKFTNSLDLETMYATNRPKTFFGYFDGLPRIW